MIIHVYKKILFAIENTEKNQVYIHLYVWK